jgi:hypothetical protein
MGLKFGIVAFSVVLGIARTAGVHSKGYQAVAHLWVGLLFGVALGVEILDRVLTSLSPDSAALKDARELLCGLFLACFCSAIAISVVELICFLRALFWGHK